FWSFSSPAAFAPNIATARHASAVTRNRLFVDFSLVLIEAILGRSSAWGRLLKADAILEIGCVGARRAESRCHVLADLASVNAVDDHLAAERQLFSPLLHLVRVTMVGRDDELARGGKIGGAPNVNDGRRRGSSEPTIKLSRRDRRESSRHPYCLDDV